jgi:hypothetical protein
MANNTLLATDTFQRANENPLSDGGNWATIPGMNACQLLSNAARGTVLNQDNGVIWTGRTWGNDQISECTIAAIGTAEPLVLVVRQSATLQNRYQFNVNIGSTSNIFKIIGGVATSLAASSGLISWQAGDVVTFMVSGGILAAYRNYQLVCWVADTTITSGGFPGFSTFTTSSLADTQAASWRGYSLVQQDGIWQKQGVVIPLIAGETGNATSNGTQNPFIIREGNAQILSGTVYKMWFTGGQNLAYAESIDGINWTRYPSYLLTGEGTTPAIIKVGSTYHLYCMPGNETTFTVQHYTSTDGIHWVGGATVFDTSVSGTPSNFYYFSPFYIDPGGTWYAFYAGVPGQWNLYLATSPDGITWTNSGSNPVALNFWGVVMPTKIGANWWAWGQTANLSQGAAAPADPGEGRRASTQNFTAWTNFAHSAHHSQMYEDVNGIIGGFYPSFVIDVNGRGYLYGTNSIDDISSGQTYQISLAIAPVPMAQLITAPEDALAPGPIDTFAQVNENPLSSGGKWSLQAGGGNLQVVSHVCEPATAGGGCGEVYTGATVSADHYASMTLGTLASSALASPMVRADTATATFYYAQILGPTGTLATTQIKKNVSGTVTAIGPSVAFTPTLGDIITLSAIGNVISLYQNGFLILQVQDNSIATGNPGLNMFAPSAVSDAKVTAFTAGNANVIPSYSAASEGLGFDLNYAF